MDYNLFLSNTRETRPTKVLYFFIFYRKDAVAKKKLQVADVPWRPANPPKKAGGLGLGNLSTHYGTVDYKGAPATGTGICFVRPLCSTMSPCLAGAKTPAFPEGGRIEYQPVGSAAKLKKGDVQFSLPNILTNPIKKVPST